MKDVWIVFKNTVRHPQMNNLDSVWISRAQAEWYVSNEANKTTNAGVKYSIEPRKLNGSLEVA